MKLSAALFLVSIATAFAFTSPNSQRGDIFASLGMANEDKWGAVDMEVKDVTDLVNNDKGFKSKSESKVGDVAPKTNLPTMSQAIPFLKRPAALDGSMAGDVGFDPFGFAKTSEDLVFQREAEIKHARLAMLAAAGWPISELYDAKIAGFFGMFPLLDENHRVPSVLNGGMGKISPTYWIGCLALAAAAELYGLTMGPNKNGYRKGETVVGNLGFDPLGMYPKSESERKWMETAEIKNGRLAMIAITAFAAQEFVTHVAVVDETPFFFKPIWETMSQNANSGYYIPPVETTSITETLTPAVDTAASTAVDVAPTTTDTAASVAPSIMESTTTVSPPVEAVSTPTSSEELVTAQAKIDDLETRIATEQKLAEANKRIADLESKLNEIKRLSN